jgi:LruC domain-containing protein
MIMGNRLYIKQIISAAFIIIIAFLGSCEKDVFNPEKVKATYEDRFPVKDIDPQMDWKMTASVNVNVAVYEDVGIDYTVRVYDGDPLENNSSAKLLAEGSANDNQPFTTVMDCPIATTEVYVCRIDPDNRNVVKLVSIKNNSVNTTFGISPTISQASTQTKSRSITRSGNVTPQSPDRSESEIEALAKNAKELTTGTNLFAGDIYKISQGTTFHGNIATWGIYNTPATVIIEGTWSPTGNESINAGVDIIVMKSGRIILPDNSTLSLIGNTRFISYVGGSIEGQNASIRLTNASGQRTSYNGGNINLEEFQMNGTGILYNSGTSCQIGYLNITNVGGKLVNMGHAIIASTNNNCKIENGCLLEVTDQLNGDLTMGDNCSTMINNYGRGGNSNKNIIMGNNSMLYIQNEAYFSYGTSFTGPTNGYALVKINKLTSMNGFKYNGGNIYYEVKDVEINSSWEKNTFLKYLVNSDGVLSKWGESPILIPAGDCTGSGNTPNNTGSDTPTDPMPYTYVFEDNFPLVGDYDFNDVVLDVSLAYDRKAKTNAIKQIEMDVTLTAAGARKILGGGLRIIGINKSAIKDIKTSGDDTRFQATLTSPRDKAYTFFDYDSKTYMEDNDANIVIPLFNNVHQVFGVDDGTIVNTQSTAPESVNGHDTYTYKIIFSLSDQTQTDPIFSKDNLDFFICYKYKNMEKRMEVHLYEFWNYGATTAGTIQQENLDLAGNNTWAVCVPNFRYPKERVNISVTSSPSEGAYPYFLNWARNREVNQDWYLFPNEDKVCR